jgi:hypothetical protein
VINGSMEWRAKELFCEGIFLWSRKQHSALFPASTLRYVLYVPGIPLPYSTLYRKAKNEPIGRRNNVQENRHDPTCLL